MHLSKVIQSFGYSANAARVYLASLGRGEATVSDLAAAVGLPRTSVQAIVEALHKDGLMNIIARRRYKYWVAENPERLLISLKEREAALRAVMPELSALRCTGGAKPTVKVFRGVGELRLIHDDIVATKQPVKSIIAWKEWEALLGKEYLSDFVERRVRHHLCMDLLAPRSPDTARLRERDGKDLRVTRFLPDGYPIHTTNFIYGNKVALISLGTKEPTGLIIGDGAIAGSEALFFDLLWEKSE